MSVTDGRGRFAEARETEADRRDAEQDAREARADAREKLAEWRDLAANAREARADAREAEADKRDADQDARERGLDARDAGSAHLDVLTRREREVFGLIAEGLSNEAIAAQLYLSINSVKSIIRKAYRKAEVETRTQAVLWYLHGTPGTDTPADGAPNRPSISS